MNRLEGGGWREMGEGEKRERGREKEADRQTEK